MALPSEPMRSFASLSDEELEKLKQRALESPHAHLVFADAAGKLRDLRVRKLCLESGTLPSANSRNEGETTALWDDSVAVTNDASILQYLAASEQAIPAFPIAGDRPKWLLNPALLRVGIVNAGGPAPGLNVVNDSITKRHFDLAYGKPQQPTVIGYRRGFYGLWKREDPQEKLRLVPSRSMLSTVGAGEPEYLVTDDHALDSVTFLHSSRFKLKDHLDEVAKKVVEEELDFLYVVGGDGSLKGAQAIKDKTVEMKYKPPNASELIVIGGPKTMDNDILYADATFGFTTTVDHLVKAIRVFHSTIECQDRVGVMQVFGAASGYVALYAAYSSGEVDFVILPEEVERSGIEETCRDGGKEVIDSARFVGLEAALEEAKKQGTVPAGVDMDLIYEKGFVDQLRACFRRVGERLRKKRHALVVIAEGAPKQFAQATANPWGNVISRFEDSLKETKGKDKGKSEEELIEKREDFSNVNVTDIEPKYLIRDNPPRSYDIAMCKIIGKAMVDAALAGYTDCVVTRWCGQHVMVPLHLATCMTSRVDPQDYFYRTMVSKYRFK